MIKLAHSKEKDHELHINTVSAQKCTDWPRKARGQNIKDHFCFEIFHIDFEILAMETTLYSLSETPYLMESTFTVRSKKLSPNSNKSD